MKRLLFALFFITLSAPAMAISLDGFVYWVDGADNRYPISGAEVMCGSTLAYTDTRGYYTISGDCGEISISYPNYKKCIVSTHYMYPNVELIGTAESDDCDCRLLDPSWLCIKNDTGGSTPSVPPDLGGLISPTLPSNMSEAVITTGACSSGRMEIPAPEMYILPTGYSHADCYAQHLGNVTSCEYAQSSQHCVLYVPDGYTGTDDIGTYTYDEPCAWSD